MRKCGLRCTTVINRNALQPLQCFHGFKHKMRYAEHLAPPSLSSFASLAPVLAPEGTAPRKVLISVVTSASTVGLPRESKICLLR